jgi:hypothetical protein
MSQIGSASMEEVADLARTVGEVVGVHILEEGAGASERLALIGYSNPAGARRAADTLSGRPLGPKFVRILPCVPSCTLYVLDVPVEWSTTDLGKLVSQKAGGLMRWEPVPDAGEKSDAGVDSNYGLAMCFFASAPEAHAAAQLWSSGGLLLGGWPVTTLRADMCSYEAAVAHAKVKAVHVGNVPNSAMEDELRSLLEEFGTVEKCIMGKNNYAILNMGDRDQARAAVTGLQDRTLQGRRLDVSLAHPPVSKTLGPGGAVGTTPSNPKPGVSSGISRGMSGHGMGSLAGLGSMGHQQQYMERPVLAADWRGQTRRRISPPPSNAGTSSMIRIGGGNAPPHAHRNDACSRGGWERSAAPPGSIRPGRGRVSAGANSLALPFTSGTGFGTLDQAARQLPPPSPVSGDSRGSPPIHVQAQTQAHPAHFHVSFFPYCAADNNALLTRTHPPSIRIRIPSLKAQAQAQAQQAWAGYAAAAHAAYMQQYAAAMYTQQMAASSNECTQQANWNAQYGMTGNIPESNAAAERKGQEPTAQQRRNDQPGRSNTRGGGRHS